MTVTPQSTATLLDIAQAILQHRSFALCGHVSPDGDCIGSMLALAGALRACGKSVVCLTAADEALDASLASLPGADKIIPAKGYAESVDVFIALDVPTLARLGDAAAVHERASLTVTIDHHACDRHMSDLNYIDPTAASTTMLVWELVGLFEVELGPDVAQCAYTGLMTDTGGFRFQNADARAFSAAAEMVAAGADPAASARDFFQNRSLPSFRLSHAAFDHLRLLGDDESIALAWLSVEDKERAAASYADAEPIIDELRSLRGVRVACLLREQDEAGIVRGSLRAKDTTNVERIARLFGGGGHRAAAGFTLEVPLAEAVELLATTLKREAGS